MCNTSFDYIRNILHTVMAKHNMASLSIAHSSPSSSFCTKDVLIIVSSVTQQRDKELIAQEVCYRSQGTLTHLDKQFLRESRIPCDQWQNEARILEAQFHKGKELYNVVEVLDDPEMGASAVLKKITDLCRSTRKFGSMSLYILHIIYIYIYSTYYMSQSVIWQNI